ncbi:ammonium transporter 2-like [Agrilus planipennis]|uniref:Ammonium transporter 2-like n=1 Tax=Agrilus planipennis TaxID=224129 RepID=A0A7F5QY31_AGRPL|nr:ammonium transporter 2-like [Agrilus planipennis]
MGFITGKQNLSTAVDETFGKTQNVFQVFSALILRGGFILIQLGSIPTEDISTILMQNVVDVAVSLLSFISIGFIFAFGDKSKTGVVGYGSWISLRTKQAQRAAILGCTASLIGSSVKTTLLSARLHFVAYLLSSFLYSGFCQPFIMHWLWHEKGWMRKIPFLNHSGYLRDHGGNLTVHTSSSLSGLVGSIFLGRRLLRLKELDPSSIGTESSGISLLGYFLIASGLITFNVFNAVNGESVAILINDLIAVGTGLLAVAFVEYVKSRAGFNHWVILRCSQGAVASLVIIGNGIDVYSPLVTFFVAFLGAITYYFCALFVYKSSLEDYCNIVSTHLLTGILGFLLPPLVSKNSRWGNATSVEQRCIHFIWHALFVMVVMVFTVSLFTTLFLTLNSIGLLRNKLETISHERSEYAADRTRVKCCLRRLFAKNDFYIAPGHSRRNLSLSKNICLHEGDSVVQGKSFFRDTAPESLNVMATGS